LIYSYTGPPVENQLSGCKIKSMLYIGAQVVTYLDYYTLIVLLVKKLPVDAMAPTGPYLLIHIPNICYLTFVQHMYTLCYK